MVVLPRVSGGGLPRMSGGGLPRVSGWWWFAQSESVVVCPRVSGPGNLVGRLQIKPQNTTEKGDHFP